MGSTLKLSLTLTLTLSLSSLCRYSPSHSSPPRSPPLPRSPLRDQNGHRHATVSVSCDSPNDSFLLILTEFRPKHRHCLSLLPSWSGQWIVCFDSSFDSRPGCPELFHGDGSMQTHVFNQREIGSHDFGVISFGINGTQSASTKSCASEETAINLQHNPS
jgi:hypothetical protein